MENAVKIEQKYSVALVRESGVLLPDGQAALDSIASVRYETGCDAVVFPKAALPEAFFQLSTGLAGEILQKFINYHMRVAFVGSFSDYASKNLNNFFYESNQGNSVFFFSNEDEALSRLGQSV